MRKQRRIAKHRSKLWLKTYRTSNGYVYRIIPGHLRYERYYNHILADIRASIKEDEDY